MSLYIRTFQISIKEVEIVLLVAFETLKGVAITYILYMKLNSSEIGF